MNILFVNRMMATAWGGGENYDYNLARELRAMGHSVRFLSGRAPGSPAPERVGDIEMTTVETPYLRRFLYALAGKVRYIPGIAGELDSRIFQPRVLRRVEELNRERAIDIVQVLGSPRISAALASRGFSVVMRFPGPPAWFLEPGLRRFDRLARTAMFSHGDTVRLFRERIGVGIHEVPPGIVGSVFRPVREQRERVELRRALALDEDAVVLVTVGRLIHGKGHGFLLEAMPEIVRRVPVVRLVAVGDGALRESLERKAEQLGVAGNVVFAGQQSRDDVARWLRASDVFCLLSEYENYSNAALEGMACGLPVIATRVGGFPLQVREGWNGYLVDSGDVVGLAAKASAVAADATLRAKLSEGAVRFAAGFDWAASAARVAQIYSEVAA